MTIRVLVVEDEPLTAQAHRSYVERVPGFAVAGVCLTATDAMFDSGPAPPVPGRATRRGRWAVAST